MAGRRTAPRSPGPRLVASLLALGGPSLASQPDRYNADRIQPYSANPFYWQYHGKPVLLLGGSDDDNLYQWDEAALRTQLDRLVAAGGNVVRNTMSSRDEGDVQPFARVGEEFDLDRWNEEYWRRFERFLHMTRERGVFVQIELWDLWDFQSEWGWKERRAWGWGESPWNPARNRNYTFENTRLKADTPRPMQGPHPFFQTIPAVNNDAKVLRYQRRYIDKLLSISLEFDHVLYCIDNEIHPPYPPEWGWYWAAHLRRRATERGRGIEVTEMYWQTNMRHEQHRGSLDRPELYSFFEASQNSGGRKDGQSFSDHLQYIRGYLAKSGPRPINGTKIYGADSGPEWTGPTRAAAERFWLNIFGGSASARFHRPNAGIGLTDVAQRHIRGVRMLTDELNVFTCTPRNDLLSDRQPNEAYCLAEEGARYALYYPDGGSIELDLTKTGRRMIVRWLDISSARWQDDAHVPGGGKVRLAAPGAGPWAAVIIRPR